MSINEITGLIETLAPLLVSQGATVTTAESCTGGWIAKALTDKPGSSSWFEYGFVSYSNKAKTQLLGVDEALLQQHGAVSEPVVRAMARGALLAAGSDWAVAVSGVAGPDGGSPDKPVGTVWMAWGRHLSGGLQLDSECFLFNGSRDGVRRQTVVAGLSGLVDRVRLDHG